MATEAEHPPSSGPSNAPASGPDILIICRANIARSPLMRLRLQWEADRRLGPGGVRIGSAGVYALFGETAADGSVEVAARWELSLDDHASLPIMYAPFATSLLNLVMSRSHRRALIARNAEVANRTFTVPEFVQCLERLDRHDLLPDLAPPNRSDLAPRQAVRSHLTSVAELAAAHRPTARRRGRDLDVPDPIAGGQRAFDALGERFETEARIIADALFGPTLG